MRTMRAQRFLRVGALVLLVAIVVGASISIYRQVTAYSYHDLLSALRAQGAHVQEAGRPSTLLFVGASHGLVVNGVQLAAYEYSSTFAAQFDASRMSPDGSTTQPGVWPFGGQAVSVDWIAPPHHFRKGRVIVSYIGSDASILRLLTAVLGRQFAGEVARSQTAQAIALSPVACPDHTKSAAPIASWYNQVNSPHGVWVRRA
jgi:hypothetical protein